MRPPTFDQINSRAAALPYSDLANRIQTMCAEAADNAAKIGGEPMSHLETSLCFSEDHDVCAWFAKNDVTY